MSNAWLAAVGADPKARAREIAGAHSTFISTHALAGVGPGLRDVVARSWMRSADAHVGLDGAPPVTLVDDGLDAYRSAHPLSRVIDVLRHVVGAAAEDGDNLMAVADASGRLLWVEGNRVARTRAEKINFVEGAWWDEAHAGTNAPGTALALDHEVQIFATEHFLPSVQDWTCSAAPIHDPLTGRIIGVIDITGGDGVANPMSLGLVRAAALASEAELARSGLWLPPTHTPTPAPTVVRLAALGRGEGMLCHSDGILGRSDGTLGHSDGTLGHGNGTLGRGGPLGPGGRTIRLHRRHTELMIMLLLHPAGLTGEQLAGMLYDDLANPATLRVEIARLRQIVGNLVTSRPYRLVVPVAADFLDVANALHAGDVTTALHAYAGPLLPSSEAPGVVRQREWLATQLRSVVLTSFDPDLVRTYADQVGFDDLQIWERLASIAPMMSAHRVVAAARTAALRADYGLPTGLPPADST